MYKVVIPSAGTGSRVGHASKFMNKALLTIGTKPAITHIIDKFPEEVEVVVLLGYKGDYVKQVLTAFYPHRKITFVEVDKYEGEGSGLGYSLLCAQDALQCPFVFCSNDTIVPGHDTAIDPSVFGNWMGYYHADDEKLDLASYRTVNIEESQITNINPKGTTCPNIYIGLAGIKDYEAFWKLMQDAKAVEVGESYGLKALTDIRAIKFKTWCDTGNLEALQKTKKRFKDDEFNILDKDGESIWFTDNRVIKFSIDETFISDRIRRLKSLDPNLFPEITYSDKNLYVYNKIPGKVLSDVINTRVFDELMTTMKRKMWDAKNVPEIEKKAVISACWDFYQKKTYERVALFLDKYEVVDAPDNINGLSTPTTKEMLNGLDWEWLCTQPHVSGFHGDFHNENIILSDNCRPLLIDWRQNFSKGMYEFGDAYYDLAKFNHGLIVSHKSVHHDQFTVRRDPSGNVFIDIDRPFRLVEVEQRYYDWLNTNGFDVKKVKILTALVYLNVAGLHEYPYSLFLYYLGKYLLHKWSNE